MGLTKASSTSDIRDVLSMGGTGMLLGSLFAKNPRLSRNLMAGGLGSHIGSVGLGFKQRKDAEKRRQQLREALLARHLQKQASVKDKLTLLRKIVLDPFIEAPKNIIAASKMPGAKNVLSRTEEAAEQSLRRMLPAKSNPGATQGDWLRTLQNERNSLLRKEYSIPEGVSGEALEAMAKNRAGSRRRRKWGEGALDLAVLGSGKVIDTALAPYLIASGQPLLGAALYASPMAHAYKWTKDLVKNRAARSLAKP